MVEFMWSAYKQFPVAVQMVKAAKKITQSGEKLSRNSAQSHSCQFCRYRLAEANSTAVQTSSELRRETHVVSDTVALLTLCSCGISLPASANADDSLLSKAGCTANFPADCLGLPWLLTAFAPRCISASVVVTCRRECRSGQPRQTSGCAGRYERSRKREAAQIPMQPGRATSADYRGTWKEGKT